MARPPTERRIPEGLGPRVFKPQGIPVTDLSTTGLTLDGLEALRLSDLLGLYQDEAARRMGVSRATYARVLTGARASVALALVEGRALEIGGGPVRAGPERPGPCPVHGRRRRGRRCGCGRGQGGPGFGGRGRPLGG